LRGLIEKIIVRYGSDRIADPTREVAEIVGVRERRTRPVTMAAALRRRGGRTREQEREGQRLGFSRLPEEAGNNNIFLLN
jgi:hypothetical protein